MKIKLYILITILFTLIAFISISNISYINSVWSTSVVHAEDEEDEEHEEDEDEHEEDNEEDEEHEEDEDDDDEEYEDEDDIRYETIIYEYNEVEIGEYEEEIPDPQYTFVTIIDPGFGVDSDGDKLVDAIDPNPDIPQQLLFTDTDGDSVPDASDEYNGEDDFLFVEFIDINNNGILDTFE